MNRKLSIFCVLCVSAVISIIAIAYPPSVYANSGTGNGSPTYYYRDNKLSAGVTGGTADDFGYNWVEIIGQGGIQIPWGSFGTGSTGCNIDVNSDASIPVASRGTRLINYYDWNPGGTPANYAYRFRIYRGGVICMDWAINSGYSLSQPYDPSQQDNQNIPYGASYHEYLIYPWWDQLVQGNDSWIGYRMDGVKPYRRFIITFYHLYHTSLPYVEGEEAERSITFQVIMYEPPMGMTTFTQGNDIVFNYQDAKFEYWDGGSKVEVSSISRGASATIGIELDGTRYINYSFNTASVNDGSAILFSRTNYTVNVKIPSAPVSLVSAGTPIKRGTHQAFERFSLQTLSGTTQWVNVKIDKRGSALDSDVASVDVYKDTNGDGQWNAGDSLLGSGTFSNGTTIVSTNDAITTSERYYFIVMRIKENVTGGKTLGVRVRYRTYLQFSSSDNLGVLWSSNF